MNIITDREPLSHLHMRAMRAAPSRIRSMKYYVDLGVLGDEVEVSVRYLLMPDKTYGLYPDIHSIVISDRTQDLFNRDIYGEKFSTAEKNTIIEAIREEEGLEI